MKATLHIHTHCQVAQKTNRTSQNLSKSMAAPTLTEKKARATTLYKRNARESADMKVITLNELSAKLKGKSLEIPHYAYSSRCAQ